MEAQIPVGKTLESDIISLNLSMANRHGLIAGATGTGKTVSLQKIAEQFSKAGIPVFTADVKGDLSGIAFPADKNTQLEKILATLQIKDYHPEGSPVIFWDIFGKNGHALRTTISAIGPLLLARLLGLNDIQQGVLNAAFAIADDQGLLLIDLKDLQSLLIWMKENAQSLQGQYGNITGSTLGAIQRGLLSLATSGGKDFFGEPAFDIKFLFEKNKAGHGIINILDATKLINDPILYSTFLLWLLSELFEKMPEVGDIPQPKLVFFFDEAHLLFKSAPKLLLEKIEQLVRLIRSKGIGVYFITQNPIDVPESVLAQLGNRIQHALRAFTAKDQKAIKAAAQTFRNNPKLDTINEITALGVGEALLSFLDEKGVPSIVRKAKVMPPVSRIGAISETERQTLLRASPFYDKYLQKVDRESAYEVLQKKLNIPETVTTEATETKKSRGRPRQSVTEAILVSTARSVGTHMGKQIVRGILGSIFNKK